MHRDFTRAERRQLRELAGLAWDRERGAELAELEAAFRQWRAGELSPHELSDRIHRFHNGAARELYVLYTSRIHPSQLVARAVAADILAESEVPAELLPALASAIEFYRTDWPSGVAETEEDDGTPVSGA
jgi:hypothetical protein